MDQLCITIDIQLSVYYKQIGNSALVIHTKRVIQLIALETGQDRQEHTMATGQEMEKKQKYHNKSFLQKNITDELKLIW